MKKTRGRVARLLLHTGVILMVSSGSIQVHAQSSTAIQSPQSEASPMHEQNMDKQHEAILALLDEAMTILRDGKSFNPESGIFGAIRSTDEGPENTGRVYRYENDTMPPSKLVMTTEADPLNYFEDRSKVAVVPSQLLLRFYKPVRPKYKGGSI
ncbi:hypothetical protein PWP93_28420 [Paraburkholderia sp. A1RI-2L]|uniref:hypothetical protein n=1 Tax=Paraburkholderia sp. A1RI-2L TaxID=3028367 RepID=UPI003B7A2F94